MHSSVGVCMAHATSIIIGRIPLAGCVVDRVILSSAPDLPILVLSPRSQLALKLHWQQEYMHRVRICRTLTFQNTWLSTEWANYLANLTDVEDSSVSEKLKDKVQEHIKSFPLWHIATIPGKIIPQSCLSLLWTFNSTSLSWFVIFFWKNMISSLRQKTWQTNSLTSLFKIWENQYTCIMTSLLRTSIYVHFSYPHTDSCSTCDGLRVQIEAATESERRQLDQKPTNSWPKDTSIWVWQTIWSMSKEVWATEIDQPEH